MQGGRPHHGALGISHSVPIVVNGTLAPRPFIPESSINTVKNLWILQHQCPARDMEGQQQFISLIYSPDGPLAHRAAMNQHVNKSRSQINYFGCRRFRLQSHRPSVSGAPGCGGLGGRRPTARACVSPALRVGLPCGKSASLLGIAGEPFSSPQCQFPSESSPPGRRPELAAQGPEAAEAVLALPGAPRALPFLCVVSCPDARPARPGRVRGAAWPSPRVLGVHRDGDARRAGVAPPPPSRVPRPPPRLAEGPAGLLRRSARGPHTGGPQPGASSSVMAHKALQKVENNGLFLPSVLRVLGRLLLWGIPWSSVPKAPRVLLGRLASVALGTMHGSGATLAGSRHFRVLPATPGFTSP